MTTPDLETLIHEIETEIAALPERRATPVREVRRRYSRRLADAPPSLVLNLARELVKRHGWRSLPYELVRYHRQAFAAVDAGWLAELSGGMASWSGVDSFARILAGPAWLRGKVSDATIEEWAHSPDMWWRRAALVATVGLNMRSDGASGDTERTLAICRLMVDDHEDMIVKALSWALRELIVHDEEAVRAFLAEYEEALAARVKREVRNKLETGLKNPRRVA